MTRGLAWFRTTTVLVAGVQFLSIAGAAQNHPSSIDFAVGARGSAAQDSSVPAKLRSLVAAVLKVDESKVTPTAAFVKDLGADELALVELVMAYEREFKIEISDAEADQFRQVRDVVAYLRKRGVLNVTAAPRQL